MKHNATIETPAHMRLMVNRGKEIYEGRPCMLIIDGEAWHSPFPQNAGQCESFNAVAMQICERLNR